MTGHPGYLLPAGECYTEELACAIVFYPDKPEYRRALLGSIVYLSTWLAWERDSEKRGKDAARAWKDAVDETVECWTMSCFEELIADVATIRQLMETKKDCCDENVTYFPTEEPSTEIEPLIGDPPELYGETEVADWDDWLEHVCYNAHAYVDYLISTSYQLQNAVNISSIFIGLISSALVLLAFSGIGLPIAFGLAAAVVTGIALGATATTFQSTGTHFETARTDIVCAILNGADLADAIETALSSGTDWDLFYQFVDYDSAIAILYEGGYGSDYLPSETSDTCECAAGELFEFTWDEDADGWSGTIPVICEWNAGGWIECRRQNDNVWGSASFWNWGDLEDRFEFTGPLDYDQLRFSFYNYLGSGSSCRFKFYFRVSDIDEVVWTSPIIDTNDYSNSAWHDIIFNMDQVYETGINHYAFTMSMFMYCAPYQGQRLYIDNFGLFLK